MKKISFPIGFAIAGFLVGVTLCGYTFYLTSHHQLANTALFLILCPPSIGALALDNAALVGSLFGWLIISFSNAGFYALIGTGLRQIDRRR